MEGVANTIIDVIIITITLAIIIAFVQVRTSISSLSQSSLSPVIISITRLFRASGHTLDKNSFSFEIGVPTALSTEDFYEDQQKVTNTLAMIMDINKGKCEEDYSDGMMYTTMIMMAM